MNTSGGMSFVWRHSMGLPTYCLVVTAKQAANRKAGVARQCRLNTQLHVWALLALVSPWMVRKSSSMFCKHICNKRPSQRPASRPTRRTSTLAAGTAAENRSRLFMLTKKNTFKGKYVDTHILAAEFRQSGAWNRSKQKQFFVKF